MKQTGSETAAELAIGEVETLALAYAARGDRPRFLSLFAIDERMRRTVSSAREPLLAQMRLAWWRDQLTQIQRHRSGPDPLLALIATSWKGEARPLVALVDGWEALLAEIPRARDDFETFIEGRADAAAGLARMVEPAADEGAVKSATRCWTTADLLAKLRVEQERDAVKRIAAILPQRPPLLPRSLRPLTVLAVLGTQALSRGGEPLLTRRSDALRALRAGLLGR